MSRINNASPEGVAFFKQPAEKRKRRRKWFKRESDTRKIERKIYNAQVPEFLKEHPLCQMNCTPGCTKAKPRKATQVHHTRGRGKYYLARRTWMAGCFPCHEWENSHRNEAVKLGLRVRVYEKHDKKY